MTMVAIYRTTNVVLLVCLVSIFVLDVYGQIKTADICTAQQTCAACIRTSNCIWCGEVRPIAEKTVSQPRCVNRHLASNETQNWCRQEMIVDQRSVTSIVKDLPFSSVKNRQIQVTPQRVKMALRRGETETLKIGYKQAEDYPVDLYFLMDLSASMEKHRTRLSNLGLKLANAMSEITSNFRLGFGSFVDKVALPMTSPQAEWIRSCTLNNGKRCAPPYGYKNQMPLTSDISRFQNQVISAPISGNFDLPEGGLDGLMQALVCQKEIGWRENARHILVYSSDASYHLAGDGKLAGVIEPNDEQCHLNSNGFYTHSEILDYPSLAQINQQARDHNVNIIFAVVEPMKQIYQDLSDYINGSSIGILDENSENVISIIRKEYEKLTNTITMTSNATGLVEVKYYTKCVNTDGRAIKQERNECSGVRVNTPLEFEVDIKATNCPERPEDWHQTIEIKPQGINERVIIDLEFICDCSCSKPDHQNYIEKAEQCSRQGNLSCGICSCDEGFFGKDCRCKGDDSAAQSAASMAACRSNNSTSRICSGRGKCVCGACVCDLGPNPGDKFSGKFCQCDNFSCQRSFGEPCGGPQRGKCECGSCVCNPGLGGGACDCSTTNSTCIPPGENTKICNGYGNCVCGTCECDTKEGRNGQYCEECPTCPSQRCDELRDCVECHAYKSGPEFVDGIVNCPKCDNIDLEILNGDKQIDKDPKVAYEAGNHICTMPDSGGCTFVFMYKAPTRGDTVITMVIAEKEKKCPETAANALIAAGSAILLTLLLGLLSLLIWKVLTMHHDHREFIKFENERVCATYEGGTNPIFKEPTSTFKNPTFSTDD